MQLPLFIITHETFVSIASFAKAYSKDLNILEKLDEKPDVDLISIIPDALALESSLKKSDFPEDEVVEIKSINKKSIAPSYNWENVGISLCTILLLIPLINFIKLQNPSKIHQQFITSYNSIAQVAQDFFSESNFDKVSGPLALTVGLPLLRCICYVSALSLVAKKTIEGISSLFSKKHASTTKEKKQLPPSNHLFRDILFILGLLGTGLYIEGIESDLNLHLQRLDINKKPLTHLLNGNFTGCWSLITKELFQSDDEPVQSEVLSSALSLDVKTENPSNVFNAFTNFLQNHFFKEKISMLQINQLIITSIYSMQKIRLTQLKTYSPPELVYGIPLSYFDDPEKTLEFFSLDKWKKFIYDAKDCFSDIQCLMEKKNQLLKFIQSPTESLQNHFNHILHQTIIYKTHKQIMSSNLLAILFKNLQAQN